ncbi:unnamed protein product [Fusarium graminearum]|uniref:Chromosome 4, complete genome n=1 Tax=Gibberella zeae (strain ATCC MYA-4620 / CBS 123657 / FGSC 9075 / NRRL 31084 / PH-1) TaxID=229533 RepID=I1S847_GIBZE|nr:hypothetical protein FGSG_13023 [Fusarium graminearum PH-1]ESU13112.1 hypothetical protein FGSG_13023 [Fusarium graminearum PH-1]CEF85347.1 unnamed protein product [Fusarium graminearum]CZS72702.1 unnamed protein product [Fusarium graminearum]|eukprot:XP_011326619.1 hypothetical protein FGSG_13023 [Fusarium graminearum PH-1]
MTTNVGWMDHGHRVAARSPGIGYSKLNMYNFRVLQICIKDIFSWILDAFQTLAKSSLDSPRLLLKLPGPLVAHGPVISHRAAWSDGLMLLLDQGLCHELSSCGRADCQSPPVRRWRFTRPSGGAMQWLGV